MLDILQPEREPDRPLTAETAGEGTAQGYEREKDDWYIEPHWMVNGLLDAQVFSGTVWDPCCGWGMIPRTFRMRGYNVRATDIVNRGCPGWRPCNFFLEDGLKGADNIVSNPPYKKDGDDDLALTFVRKALPLVRHKLAIVQKFRWLEGKKRYEFFKEFPPAHILFCSSRANMLPGSMTVKHFDQDINYTTRGGNQQFCWFIWSKDHKGPPTVSWMPPYSPNADHAEGLL